MRPLQPSSRGTLFLFITTALSLAGCDGTTDPVVATRLGFTTQPAPAAAGAVITPPVVVAVQDGDGNTVTTATNAVTVALGSNPGGGTLSGTTTVTAVNGVATFADLRISGVGAGYTLAVSSPGLTGATSAPFSVTAGAASKLGFVVQPGPVTAGAAIAPAVTVAVQDAAGSTLTGATNPISLAIGTNAGSGTLSGITTVAAVTGVATFSGLSIDKAAAGYTLAAASPGLLTATSNPFPVAAGPAGLLAFTVQPSAAPTGMPISPAVAVAIRDQFGNPVTTATHSVTLTLGANPGAGTLSGTVSVAAVNGVATFSGLSIDKPGTGYTLTATAAGLTAGTSAGFNIRDPLVLATISAGYFHSCGVNPAGVAWCWGDNVSGQLGNNSGSPSNFPVQVAGGLVFAGLEAGRTHTCGVTTAGAGYCWGDNALGSGTGTARAPRPVAGTLTFARVVAGYAHSCGVTSSGAGHCWGSNGLGELGNGTTTSSNVPVLVSGGLVFASISPGRVFSCGLTTAGKAYCWGSNFQGELGDGTTTDRAIPAPLSGQLTFALVSAGGFHACGLTTGGLAYCWGWNEFGQLGSGGPGGSSLTPRLVDGGLTFATLSVGNRHTCGVTPAGVGYCWGENFTGMLGTGTTSNSSAPAPVAGGLIFATISAGRFHSCGVTTTGAAYCWGGGGAIGDGTDLGRLVPTRVF